MARFRLLVRVLAAAALIAAAGAPSMRAAVRTVHVVERSDVLDGRPMGRSGPYERIVARAEFTLDPHAAANLGIRDLDLAVRNADGLVEFGADVYVLKPRDPSRGNGMVLLEIPNRGSKSLLNRFCYGKGAVDPSKEEEFGDRWLLDEGYTLVWVGWQWDTPNRPNLMRLYGAPVRADADAPGLVNSEFIPDHATTRMSVADRNHEAIAVKRALRLTVRDSAESVPVEIARERWTLNEAATEVEMADGFQPGRLYEFDYEASAPMVAGLGFAAVRDFTTYLKHGGGDDVALLGDQHEHLKRAIGFGISQSGRFLRQFLYEGFNADEQGRKVFDGVWADVAGAGRGSFNFRYAQASRDGNPWGNVFYPTDVFPFTGMPQHDPATGRDDGLLSRSTALGVVPKLFLTNTSYEYWGRAAALVHVMPDGRADESIGGDTRIFFFTGAQHYPRSLPLTKVGARYDSNPTDQRPFQRALLHSLTLWVKEGLAPPPSVVPRIVKGELTTPADVHFPHLNGIGVPKHPRQALRLDFGAEFAAKGYISQLPPIVRGGFPVLVPQVDGDGNDLGGVRLPEVAVPLGTYTGWNLRAPGTGAPEQMVSFIGSFFPFARTKAERERTHDPRPSIEERYVDRADYMRRAAAMVDSLVAQRFLLERDRGFALERCGLLWDAIVH
jgi:hypothetical protein